MKSAPEEMGGRFEPGQRDAEAKVLRPDQKRQAVHFLREVYRISVRRARAGGVL